MKRSFILIGLVVALCALFAGQASSATVASASTERLGELDQRLLVEINRTRTDRGLRPLVISAELHRAAGAHSRQMLERGFFGHESPSGISFAKRVRGFYQSAGYTSWSVGENLLYSTRDVTAEKAVEAWLASPGHRQNMLSPDWREIGIGSLRSSAAAGQFGGKPTVVITVNFGSRSGKASAASSGSTKSSSPRVLGAGWTAPSASVASARPAKPFAKRKPSVTRTLPTGRASQPI